MQNKTNSGGTVLLWIVAISLLLFTAARSVHLVTNTLPEDMAILGFAALAGLDLGLLAWLFFVTRSARGGAQRVIGAIMIVADLAGIILAVLGDTLLVAGGEQWRPMVSTIATWLVPIIILSNVAAVVAVHLFDPAQAIRDSQRALSDELEYQLAEHLRQNAASIAGEVVPAAAKHKADEMVAGFLAATKRGDAQPGADGKKPNILNAEGELPRGPKGRPPTGSIGGRPADNRKS